MNSRRLTQDEFQALLQRSVENVTGREPEISPDGVIDPEPYVASVSSVDLEGHTISEGLPVEVVYRTSPEAFDLVHVRTNRKNVYLVVIVDFAADCVLGHHLLDLNKEYGLE